MVEQLDPSTFVGGHPTNAEFATQLEAWGFTRLRVEGVHILFRAPGGGRVRVPRSLYGRVDPASVVKATTLLGIPQGRFWSEPDEAEPSSTASGGEQVAPRQSPAPGSTITGTECSTTSAELFKQLFPQGVHMTADLLVDIERWSRLTEKIARYAEAS